MNQYTRDKYLKAFDVLSLELSTLSGAASRAVECLAELKASVEAEGLAQYPPAVQEVINAAQRVRGSYEVLFGMLKAGARERKFTSREEQAYCDLTSLMRAVENKDLPTEDSSTGMMLQARRSILYSISDLEMILRRLAPAEDASEKGGADE